MDPYWERIERIRQVHTALGGMLFPPATEQQISLTESAIGWGIPHPLRRYYLDLANGGFGPGYGIIGVHEGYEAYIGNIGTALGNLFDWRDDVVKPALRLYESTAVAMNHQEFRELTHLVLVDHGCGGYDEVCLKTGHIYRTGIQNGEEISLRFIAETIDDYLDFWLHHLNDTYAKAYAQMKNCMVRQKKQA